MNKMIETIEEMNPKTICMFKIGTFYHTYNRDSYIMSYIFNYKIKELGQSHKECGFPVVTLPKIIAKLEEKSINYIVIDRRNNYDVEQKTEYKDLNNYDKYFEKAHKFVNRKRRIDNITEFLNNNIEDNILSNTLSKIEGILYEGREV